MTTQPVKADTVWLALPADSLSRMPAGAVYTRRSGRATVQASALHGGKVIVIRGTCDSLQREVTAWQTECRQLRQRINASQAQQDSQLRQKKTRTARTAALCLLAGAAAGMLMSWAVRRMARSLADR